jgi:hypothetical protein
LEFATIIFLQSKVVILASNLQPGGPVSVFMSPSDRVAQLYLQAPGSLFIAFYDSQDYDGGIQTHLHMGRIKPIVHMNRYVSGFSNVTILIRMHRCK